MATIRQTGKLCLFITSALCGAAASSAAFAQAAPAPDDQLQEVVVTAQRRSEILSKVPISAVAVTRQAIDQQGIRNISDISRITPGLQVQTIGHSGNMTVAMRGIYSVVGASTTGIYVDDVPIDQRNDTRVPSLFSELFDIQRVEVLRGPQGTLYGAGSEGGTIRYITTPPSLTDMSVYARAEAGSTRGGAASWNLGAAAGGPLVQDRLGFRVSASVRKDGGWIDRVQSKLFNGSGAVIEKDTNDRDSNAFRVAVTWKPTETVTITPTVMYQNIIVHDLDQYSEALGRYTTELRFHVPAKSHYVQVSNNIDAKLGSIDFKSVSAYARNSGLFTADWSFEDVVSLARGRLVVPGVEDFTAYEEGRVRSDVFTQEFRFSNDPSARLSWTAGLFLKHTNTRQLGMEIEPQLDKLLIALFGRNSTQQFGVPLINGTLSYYQLLKTQENQHALFADVTYKLTDQLKATAGVRVADAGFSRSNVYNGPWYGGISLDRGSQSETPITPRFSISYDYDTGMVYGSASKGYRLGGTNLALGANTACISEVQSLFGISDTPRTYDSDSLWSYELGAKNRLFGNRVDISASAYHVDWSNIQGPIRLTCLFGFTYNLGQAKSDGADLSVRARPVRGLTLGADLGYTNARYTRTASLGSSTVAVKGDKLPTPPFTAALSAEYSHAFTDEDSGYARIDYNYSNPYIRRPSAPVVGNDALLRRAPPVSLVNVRAGWRRGPLDLSLYATNLFDTDVATYRYRYSTRSTYFLAQSPRPRTVGLTLTYSR